MVPCPSITPKMVIIDTESSRHGQMMRQAVTLVGVPTSIEWIPASLELPAKISEIGPPVVSVAVPLAVSGAGPHDVFVRRLTDAFRRLSARGVLVFVAAIRRGKPNPLAHHAIETSPIGTGWTTLRVGHPRFGTSGSAVAAAALRTLLVTRVLTFRRTL